MSEKEEINHDIDLIRFADFIASKIVKYGSDIDREIQKISSNDTQMVVENTGTHHQHSCKIK